MARHRASALRVAAVVLGSGDDADDVVQQATTRMWPAIGRVDAERGFRAWYLRGVANTARNHRRSWVRRRSAELRLAGRRGDDPVDPAGAAITSAEREMVLAALNRIDRDARLVLALRHFEQLSEREMAVVLDCPVGTVKSRLARATARLRVELDAEVR